MNLPENHPAHGVFPPEILIFIAAEVRHTRSLARLSRVNSQLSQALCPMLYREIHVTGIRRIQRICESVATSARQLGPLVHQLRLELPSVPRFDSFGDPTREPPSLPALQLDLIPNIRAALYKMLNLAVLSVSFQPNDFDSIFQGLSLPFRLNKFSSPFPPSIYFLRSQPSITILELPKYSHTDYDYWSEFHDRTILPSLRYVKAPDGLIWSLVPGRPVTKAVCLGAGPLLNTVTLDTLFSSSSDIIWIECVILMSSWEYCVQALVDSRLRMTLKRLCLRLLETEPRQPSAPCYQLELLSGLSVLKQLDFKTFESKKPSKQISDWLGKMNTIDTWQNLVPSLEVVTAFGRVID